MLSEDDGNFEFDENAQKDRVNDDSADEQVILLDENQSSSDSSSSNINDSADEYSKTQNKINENQIPLVGKY